jgi:hypothetical protein
VFARNLTFILCVSSLVACAHHKAVRVDCDGPLREINKPLSATPKATHSKDANASESTGGRTHAP